MKHPLRALFLTAILLFFAGPVFSQQQAAKAKKSNGGWIPLIRKNLNPWREPQGEWKVVEDAQVDPRNERLLTFKEGTGMLINGAKGKTSDLITKREFGDIEVHVEFMIPAKSNSGIYFMGRYELQIFDSYGMTKPPYPGIECGGIYERWADNKGFEGRSPRINAARKPGEWQTFDVVFRAPRFDAAGKKTANACFLKVLHNGVMVHENQEVTGPTRPSNFFKPTDEKAVGPLLIQGDHGPVVLRNVKVRPVKPEIKPAN